MGAVIEVKYFNSFLLKKVNADASEGNVLVNNGSTGIPTIIGGYEQHSGAYNEDSSWVIEEARIRGGYNNTNVDYGVRAYATSDDPKGFIRGNSLIYSGIFNSRTGINQTNVFSVGEDISKSLDPVNGSVQKLYAEDSNLIVFQESKVSRGLIDKDAIYSAEGGGTITTSQAVIGQIIPYAGEFGISKNPESFAVYGYRKYFTDKDRNAVIRLSLDGITDISRYGMYDYIRDEFNNIDSTGLPGKLVGGWDIHNKQYVLSMQPNVQSDSVAYNTLSFDEEVNGWTSFFSYKPNFVLSLKNVTYSLKNNKLYRHYSNEVNRGNFYGVQYPSEITLVFNPSVSLSKTFKTINYEGSNGWQVTSFSSDATGSLNTSGLEYLHNDLTNNIYSYREGEYVINPTNGQAVLKNDYQSTFGTINPPYERYHAGFDRKENKYVANLVNNSAANSNLINGEVLYGNKISGIKGYYATVTLKTDDTTDVGGKKELFAVSSNYVESSY
jgi:hypothetical protein